MDQNTLKAESSQHPQHGSLNSAEFFPPPIYPIHSAGSTQSSTVFRKQFHRPQQQQQPSRTTTIKNSFFSPVPSEPPRTLGSLSQQPSASVPVLVVNKNTTYNNNSAGLLNLHSIFQPGHPTLRQAGTSRQPADQQQQLQQYGPYHLHQQQQLYHHPSLVPAHQNPQYAGWLSPRTQLHEANAMVFQLLPEKQAMLDHQEFELKKKKEELEKKEEDRRNYERERSIRWKQMLNGAENQQEKMWQRQQIPLPNGISYGTNELFLNYLNTQKQQQDYPYYFLNATRQILCHCPGFSLAFVDDIKGWVKCGERNRAEGKRFPFHPFPNITWIDDLKCSIYHIIIFYTFHQYIFPCFWFLLKVLFYVRSFFLSFFRMNIY